RPWRQSREEEPPGVFLKAEVAPQRPVMGEQILYTVYLYTREDITSISPSGVPDFKGFWVRDIPLPQHLPTDMVEIDGRRYGRVPLLKKALFPLRPGRHELEPTQMDLTLRLYERRFFGPPLTRSDQVRLRTDPGTVDVRPLPPAPRGFGGAVGRISLRANLEPREVRLGEAATLTVTLSGQGNLHAVEKPRVEAPPGLTVFPPQQGGQDEVEGNRVQGVRTWSYVVIPERAGEYTLEAPEVPYFDPASGRYRAASAGPVSLTALPRAAAAAGSEGEPHGIRDGDPAPAGGSSGRWASLLPWLFALPWGLALAVTLARRRPEPAGEGAPQRGGRSAERRLEDCFAEVETEERPRQMAIRLEEGWRELLAERWDIPPETPSSRWANLLALRKAPAGTVEEAARLVEDLHYLRYAPQLSATGTLRSEVLARCRRLLRRLR
ncbi:MAG: BatD family protein, partial [Thermoanaerobaculia bacterium]